MLLLFGGLALLIWVLQPFADQVGGCGGGWRTPRGELSGLLPRGGYAVL